VWALNIEADKNYVKEIMEIFLSKKRKVYLIELESDLKTRLQRNKTELRLAEKPTKRAIDESEQRLLKNEKEYIFNTNADNLHFAKEILNESNFLKINNNNLTIDEVVKQIIAYFNF
jgi:hypothetical protein